MAYFPEIVTLDPATPASATHPFNGNIVFGTTVIPSFSSSAVRYFGNKIASIQYELGTTASAGSMNLYSNCYFDGTNNRFTIANETAVNLSITGNTTATSLVYALNASNNVSHAADATFSFTTVHSISASGLHTVGPSSGNDALVHQLHGSLNTLGAVIPSFSSTRYRYVGNKLSSSLYDNGSGSVAGNTFTYGNTYFDGTNNKRSRANETCASVVVNGGTAATSTIFTVAADPSVAGAADSTASLVAIHTIDANGLHVIGNASTNNALVHQLHGSLNTLGAVIPSYSSTRYRYIGSKLSSSYFDNGSGSAAGQFLAYGNAYFDGTNNKRSRANETCANIVLSGQTSATGLVWSVQADPSVAGAADSNASLAAIHTIDANGMHAIGNASTNNSQVHQLYGSMSLLGAVIPSFSSSTQRYIGTKLSSALFIGGSNASAGSLNLFANMYNDGSSANYGRANETCVNLFMRGATAATTTVYVLAADASVSHAADVAATVVNLHTITAQGQHVFGVSTQPVDYQHRFWNGVAVDITTSGSKSVFFRNQTTATTASVILGNAQTGNGSIRWLEFAYNGTSSASPGTVEGYIGTDGAGVMTLFDVSDTRRKTNLRPFKGAVEELKKAPIYLFDRIDNDNKDIVGFIAQDVEKIDPRLVTEHDDIKRVGRDALVHYMHAAILELTERLEKLESKKTKKKDEE